MGTAEVESALVSHAAVAEAAVVGCPHEIKGQGIYAYVTLRQGIEPTDDLLKELVKHVRAEIGPIATPDVIQWAPSLPKTRSGKIMRRILRKIAENETGQGRRHQYAGRSFGGRRPDREPPEPVELVLRSHHLPARRDGPVSSGVFLVAQRSGHCCAWSTTTCTKDVVEL